MEGRGGTHYADASTRLAGEGLTGTKHKLRQDLGWVREIPEPSASLPNRE